MMSFAPLVIDAGGIRQLTTGDKLAVPGLKDSALTPGRIVCTAADGELVDSENLQYDGSQLIVFGQHFPNADGDAGQVLKTDGAGHLSWTTAVGPAGASYAATSTTSLAIATGNKSFATQAGLAYLTGNRVRAASATDGANWMEGSVTSYLGTTLVVNVDLIGGSGTKADWNIGLAGQRGAGYAASSTTSLSPATGSRTFTTQAQLAYAAGLRVRIVSASNTDDWMEGIVSSYTGTTLTVTVDAAHGTDVKADWNIGIAGIQGIQGIRGLAGQPTPNVLINGGFDFFQRQNATVATSRADDTFGPDRWIVLTQTAGVLCGRDTLTRTTLHAVRLTQNQPTSQRFALLQIVEGVNSNPLVGKDVVFMADVCYSNSANVRMAVLEWTGTRDAVTSDVVRDWTNGTYTANNFFLADNVTVTATSSTAVTANTWTALKLTGTISSSCVNALVLIWVEATAAQNSYLQIAAAGLYQADSSVTPTWQPRSVGAELALCQRYYEKSYEIDTAPGTATRVGSHHSAVCTAWLLASPTFQFAVPKRVTISPTIYSDNNGAAGYITEYDIGSLFLANKTAGATASNSSRCSTVQSSDGTLITTDGCFCRWHWAVDAEL